MGVPPEENIVRAICTDKYDKGTGQVSPSLFTNREGNTSVSRLAITSLEDHWEVFRKTVERPQERMLELIGEINVGRLQELGRNYQNRVDLTVEPDPKDVNPAHALIPQRISRGLANEIIKSLELHSE